MSWTDAGGVLESPPILRHAARDERELTARDMSARHQEPIATYVVGGALLRARILRALDGSPFAVVGSDSDGANLNIKPGGRRPSLAIVEAGNGSVDVQTPIGTIRRRSPGTRIVLAGDFRHPNWLRQPLTRVDGLVGCDAPAEVLVASLGLVMLGAAVLPTALTGLLIAQARHAERQPPVLQAPVRQAVFDDQRFIDLHIRRLSVLEKAVLGCLKEGATNKIIARRLDLTVAAINIAMKGILRKIGVQNRTQAALWALDNLPDEGARE